MRNIKELEQASDSRAAPTGVFSAIMSETSTTPASVTTASHLDLTRRACALLDAAESTPPPLAELAGQLDVSPWHLHRVFRKVTGVTPRDYAEARRDSRFRTELRGGESVASATYGAGYGSASRVYEDAHGRLGMTPASYAKGGKGARIAYGLVDSPLGWLLVAATAHGLCFVALGERPEALAATLQAEFPKADSIRRDDDHIAPALDAVLDHIAGRIPHVDLPLDVRATAFQRRVWQGLLAIPYGETRSYKELAEELGLANAQRAVGSACGANPVALVIPCHRVKRGDGGLGGYRWGVERKRRLLAEEAERRASAGG